MKRNLTVADGSVDMPVWRISLFVHCAIMRGEPHGMEALKKGMGNLECVA
jgi:hypothetical protein